MNGIGLSELTGVGVGIIAFILILDRVLQLVRYIGNGKLAKGCMPYSSGATRGYTQEYTSLLRETLTTMGSMKDAIEKNSQETCNAMRDVSKSLNHLTSEVNQMKGKIE